MVLSSSFAVANVSGEIDWARASGAENQSAATSKPVTWTKRYDMSFPRKMRRGGLHYHDPHVEHGGLTLLPLQKWQSFFLAGLERHDA
jgi:hypothetical protein